MTTRPLVLSATPVGFTADGALDLAASRRILEFAAVSGVDGVFATGTTGEFPSLSRQERRDLTALALEAFAGRTVVVHVGAASAYETCRLLDDAREAGATAVASITPYYLPAAEASILEFYRRVTAAADGLTVYAYLFAGCTGNTVSPELLGRLAELPRLAGAKITGETLERIAAYRRGVPEDFVLYTGSDRDVAGVPAHGANGVVSGVSAAFPDLFVAMADAAGRGDEAQVAALQPRIDEVAAAVAGNPERLKIALSLRGIDAGTSRMALGPVGDAARAELARVVEAYG